MYRDYESLEVWKRSHYLVLKIYKLTENFPSHEKLGLVSPIRRSAASIPANIAEGSGTKTAKSFCKYLYDARASLRETKYHLRLAKDLSYIGNTEYESCSKEYDEVGRMLNGLINSLTNKYFR